MNIVADLLRLLLFLVSVYGYVLFIHRKYDVDEECLPAIVMSGIGCLIFLAGILNIMNLVFVLLFVAGCILALKEIRGFLYIFREPVLQKCIRLAMFVFVVYLFCYLRDVKYYHYDNFTHWGLIVKNIYINSSFPNFDDGIITFQSYPLGSSAIIWYICKIIGYSEGKTLFAQAFLILTHSYSLFLLTKNIIDKHRKIIASLLVFVTNMIIVTYGNNMANGIFNLMVDVLLAVVAISACVIVFYYRDKVYKAVLCTSPLLIFVVCVKNSGIVWVAAVFIEALILLHHKLNKRNILQVLGGILGLPLAFLLIWHGHVDMVFARGEVSAHAMSLENYSKVFGSKTSEDIERIIEAFVQKILSLNNRMWYLFIGFILLRIIIYFITPKKNKQAKHLLGFLGYLVLIYVIYQLGNLAMYLFSMPLSEALVMAGYERYVMTLELFVWGLMISIIVMMLGKNLSKRPSGDLIILCVAACVLLVYESRDVVTLIKTPTVSGRETSRVHMDTIIDAYDLRPGKKVLLYIGNPNDRDVGYRSWMSKYMLYTTNITILNESAVGTLKNMNDYDYTILLERDQVLENWLIDANLPIEIGECYVRENYNFVKFADYINNLDNDYILFMSVKDDASASFNQDMKKAMNNLGLAYDLSGKYRNSYVALIDSGNVIYENLSDERIEYSEQYAGMDIDIVSAGFPSGNMSQIMINGIDYSKNTRGINIVVYDKQSGTVKDSVTFDTWLMDGVIMEK